MELDIQLLPAINRIISICEHQLRELVGVPVKVRIDVATKELNAVVLQGLVCDAFGVTWYQMISKSREAPIVTARHVYWWLSIQWLGRSLVSLAKEMDRDHTTVISARNKVQELLEVGDPLITTRIESIEQKLRSRNEIKTVA